MMFDCFNPPNDDELGGRLNRRVVFMVPLNPKEWNGLHFNWGCAFTREQNKKAGNVSEVSADVGPMALICFDVLWRWRCRVNHALDIESSKAGNHPGAVFSNTDSISALKRDTGVEQKAVGMTNLERTVMRWQS